MQVVASEAGVVVDAGLGVLVLDVLRFVLADVLVDVLVEVLGVFKVLEEAFAISIHNTFFFS
jgi:hypothetical protein